MTAVMMGLFVCSCGRVKPHDFTDELPVSTRLPTFRVDVPRGHTAVTSSGSKARTLRPDPAH
jgi:hypothetical protein